MGGITTGRWVSMPIVMRAKVRCLDSGSVRRPKSDKEWFQTFLFSTLPGDMIQFDEYFSIGLKQPTSNPLILTSWDIQVDR